MIRRPDGRILAVQEYGDPNGSPALYFHGWPACRLEAGLIPDLSVRLLAVDRPGYGQSSPDPGRSLLDWPGDAAAVADGLGLVRFDVIGLSGGGPYAAVCAYAMPDRVRSLVLVAPVPPMGPHALQSGGVRLLYRFGKRPRQGRALLHMIRSAVRTRVLRPRALLRRLPRPDRRAMMTARVLGKLPTVWQEAFRQGVEGAYGDAAIYAGDWGFNLSDIRVPTRLWSGGADHLVPSESLEPFQAVPGIVWRHLPIDGHFSLPLCHSAEMLAELTHAAGQD